MPEADDASKGPNQEQLPHVSEEAGITSEIMGEEIKPEPEEQGTPVQEVSRREVSYFDCYQQPEKDSQKAGRRG